MFDLVLYMKFHDYKNMLFLRVDAELIDEMWKYEMKNQHKKQKPANIKMRQMVFHSPDCRLYVILWCA